MKRLVLKGSGRSWDSLATSYSRTHYSFEVLRASYFAKTKKTFAESDFESFGLADGIGNLTNAGALLADGSPVRHSRVFCTLRLIDNGNLLDTVPGESTLKKTDRTLIKIITQMPSATIAEMQDQLGITRDGVNKAVKRLKAAGVIRRVGPDNGGHWEVVK